MKSNQLKMPVRDLLRFVAKSGTRLLKIAGRQIDPDAAAAVDQGPHGLG
jgi:hypothetical protein